MRTRKNPIQFDWLVLHFYPIRFIRDKAREICGVQRRTTARTSKNRMPINADKKSEIQTENKQ